MNMLTPSVWALVALLIWFLIVMMILIFCPKDRIKPMGDFFSKVLPKIPLTGIFRLFLNNKNKDDD